MREVMLTDFATLSPSDTLADALYRCVHSLQEDFPVVRGPQLVGIVSRQRIVDALRDEGNGYVQSVMSRAFQVARPEDTLGTTIRRLTAGHGLALIPITESGRVVGIVSVQNLMSSMSLLAEQRRIERQESGRLKAPMADGPKPGSARGPNLRPGSRNRPRRSRRGSISLPLPSAIWATSRCGRSTCCATWTASPAKTHARHKSCSIIFRSRHGPSVATSTTSASARRSWWRLSRPADALRSSPMPERLAVSDPGGWLVGEAIAAGVPVIPIPGANAALSALIASGLPAGEFQFLGFLPEKAGARRTRLEKLAD